VLGKLVSCGGGFAGQYRLSFIFMSKCGLTWGKIEKVPKPKFGEGIYGTDNEFVVYVTLATPHPIDLAYRYAHGVS